MIALKQAQLFASHGWSSGCICPKDSPLAAEVLKAKLDLVPIPKSGYLAPSSSLKLRAALKELKVERILVHHLKDLWVLYPALIGLPEIKVFGMAHMFLSNVNKKDFFHQKLYGRLEKLITLNQAQELGLKNCLPLRGDQYLRIPHGVDTAKFHPSNRDENFRDSLLKDKAFDFLIGVVGRLDPKKGQLEVLQALVDILKTKPKTKLVFVGTETAGEIGYQAILEEFVKEHHLEKHVQFLGHRLDVPKILASLDLFVLPSYEEAFGLISLEAMASERPVILTDAGGSPELLDETSGLLVPPKDIEALTKTCLQVMNEPALAKSLGQNARQRVLKNFDQKVQENKIFQIISNS